MRFGCLYSLTACIDSSGAIADARFQTSGGPFSQETISRTINILPLNDAPTIADGAQVVFPTFQEDTTNDTQTVETLFASAFQDAIDAGNSNQNTFIGIAIVQDFASLGGTRLADQQIAYEKGHWEVYDIAQARWIQLPSDVSPTNAYLVPKATKIRFKPTANYNGEMPPLTVHLVDNGAGSSIGLGQRVNLVQNGVGGTTRYTATTVSMTGQIEAVNDFSPVAKDAAIVVRITANGQDDGITPPAKTVDALFASRFSDAPDGQGDGSDGDQGTFNQTQHGIFGDAGFWGIFISDVPDSTNGVWQYSANGTTWTDIAGWATGEGLYLPKSYQMRYQQTTLGVTGEAPSVSVKLVDTSIGDTNIGASLKTGQGNAIAAIATANPTPNRNGEASPLSTNSLTLGQTITPLTLIGQAGNDQLTGGDGNNTLNGQGGNDRLSGGLGNDILIGGLGNDTMIGGDGNDSYYVDSSGDVVDETNTSGVDTIFSTAPSFTLGANVENLIMQGTGNFSAIGNAIANTLTGNSGNNLLNGGAGADVLRGGEGDDVLNGGLDNDTFIGGNGNDSYYVDNIGDVVDETNTNGVDTVFSTLPDYTLGANVENLIIEGTGNANATGNSFANTLTGNSGNNILNGGAGADILIGGNGNDVYYVDDLGDLVVETEVDPAIGGIDIVFASIDYTLVANVENLTLEGSALTGIGNDLANVITGNAANNLLIGGNGADQLMGGAGNDRLLGQAGNDVLLGEVGNDVLVGAGGNDRLFGGDGNDRLQGGGGNDVLVGGLGKDVLVGGLGRDTFVLNKVRGRQVSTDKIMDFRDGQDRLGLASGLKFQDLRIVGQGRSTLIYHNNNLLAQLNGVNATQITQADVVSIQI